LIGLHDSLDFDIVNLQLISLLQKMSAENIEPISHAASNEEKSNERSVNEDLLEEVRELKKVISTLAERESLKSK
jgi:hypothetical protein